MIPSAIWIRGPGNVALKKRDLHQSLTKWDDPPSKPNFGPQEVGMVNGFASKTIGICK